MSHDLKIKEHRAIVDQAFKEAYESIAQAKAVICQQPDDPEMLMDAVESIEGRLDRVETAMTLLHGDVLELNTIVEELQRQRNEAFNLIRRMMGTA